MSVDSQLFLTMNKGYSCNKTFTNRRVDLTWRKSPLTLEVMKDISYIVKEASGAAVDGLRRAAKANDLTKTRMAEAIGVSRPNLDSRLESGDMKLTEFLHLAVAAKKKPSEATVCCDNILAEAEALAEGGE